tara:strand:- start:850 stop:1050 length:201 start_codon:yes stop_codon:yes gene_type:complete
MKITDSIKEVLMYIQKKEMDVSVDGFDEDHPLYQTVYGLESLLIQILEKEDVDYHLSLIERDNPNA